MKTNLNTFQKFLYHFRMVIEPIGRETNNVTQQDDREMEGRDFSQ